MGDGQLWGLDPGVDFPTAFVSGLIARFGLGAPEQLARTRVYLNSGRMVRRVRAALTDGPARLLPRLSLITDLGRDVPLGPMPPARSALRQRLELTRLVEALIAAEPDLAPRDAAFDLATTLSVLLDEMQGEGVGFDRIAGLDVSDLSGHWARSQRFLGLLSEYLDQTGAPPDAEGRQRCAVEVLARQWAEHPPDHPVVIAGSTGSRGTTQLLMEAVLRLPQGHVVLPGFDFDMPMHAWMGLTAPGPQEDHPQYRFADLLRRTGRAVEEVRRWTAMPPPRPGANALLSLALRPAPVTDCWQTESPGLGDLGPACDGITLIEAPDSRIEAVTLALMMRKAAEDGRRAALITPDRMLTRRVAAVLDRWGIEPDDSAGEPLAQSPAGRLLRQIAGFWTERPDAARLIALLAHPRVHSIAGRNSHLLHAREFELWQRRSGPAYPDAETLLHWASTKAPQAENWAQWLAAILNGLDAVDAHQTLSGRVTALLNIHRELVSGSEAEPEDPKTDQALWTGPDGREAARELAQLEAEAEAEAGNRMTGRDFALLLNGVLAGEVRDALAPHPGIMIWGTLEARVQGADLVLLAGLNEGIWPPTPDPDPWLNRQMRAEAGLLSPERRIGLSAHDFQQAAAAREVVFSRAVRDSEAPTVPSRWLNRVLTLLGGLPDQGGPAALQAMRARGAGWLDLAHELDRPAPHGIALPRAPRPAPIPPPGTAPQKITVSEVETLLRDPYGVYVRRILNLAPLEPLERLPDPALRGTVLHKVLEQTGPQLSQISTREMLAIAETVLAETVPWPHIRALWLGRLARVLPWFLAGEVQRQTGIRDALFERSGKIDLGNTGVVLTSKADRADLRNDGALNLYDYKTGAPPTAKQQAVFSKQLLLVAAMAEAGGFKGIQAAPVAQAAYIGLGPHPAAIPAPLADHPPGETMARVAALLAKHIAGEHGYSARRAMELESRESDYDHLARLGEWDTTEEALAIKVGNHGDG